MIVDYIDVHRAKHGVEPICEVLTEAGTQIAPSTYYAAKTRLPCARTIRDAVTTDVITRVHAENYGVYGIRKVHAECNRQGHPVARCTVQRLMRAAGLRGISRATGPRTTVAGHGPDTRPDLVQRAFTASAPDQLWVADITYCRTFAGWVYAASSSTCSRAAWWAGSSRRACTRTLPSTLWRWGCGPGHDMAATPRG